MGTVIPIYQAFTIRITLDWFFHFPVKSRVKPLVTHGTKGSVMLRDRHNPQRPARTFFLYTDVI